MERLEIDGAAIAYHVQGHGEPILLIAPALFADGLGRPLLAQPPLAARISSSTTTAGATGRAPWDPPR